MAENNFAPDDESGFAPARRVQFNALLAPATRDRLVELAASEGLSQGRLAEVLIEQGLAYRTRTVALGDLPAKHVWLEPGAQARVERMMAASGLSAAQVVASAIERAAAYDLMLSAIGLSQDAVWQQAMDKAFEAFGYSRAETATQGLFWVPQATSPAARDKLRSL
jgi:hypothetical protein